MTRNVNVDITFLQRANETVFTLIQKVVKVIDTTLFLKKKMEHVNDPT